MMEKTIREVEDRQAMSEMLKDKRTLNRVAHSTK